jgi:hypothetical protein
VSRDDGLCTAEISVQNAFGEMLNGFPQRDARTVKIIGIDPAGGFARSALVTPIGIYDLRSRDGSFDAAMGGTRTLSIRFLTE